MNPTNLNQLDADTFTIALAGLLHDIGKPRQRAGLELPDRFTDVCPGYKGGKSHLHAAHTAHFMIETFSRNKGVGVDAAYRSAAHHHLSFDQLETLAEQAVRLADHLASGHDRQEKQQEQSEEDRLATQQGNFITARMLNPFQRVQTGEHKAHTQNYVLPLQKLGPEVFPEQLDRLDKNKATQEYKTLWIDFEKSIEKELPPFERTNNWLNHLAALFEEHFSFVPASAYKNDPDTSLYDHSRLVAAFSTALHRMNPSEPQWWNLDKSWFRLIQGDFSGIQKFIFDFRGDSQRGAAKILRARSFYVAAATEAAAALLCHRFGITHLSIVMNAGGKFTILAPNLENSEALIREVADEINAYFFEQSFGQTRFNLASITAKRSDFQAGQPFRNLMDTLADELEAAKLRPEVPGNQAVFTGYLEQFEGGRELCPTCNYRPATIEKNESGEPSNGPCLECSKFRKLGEKLVAGDPFLAIGSAADCDGFKLPGDLRLTLVSDEVATTLSSRLLCWRIDDVSTKAQIPSGRRRLSAYVPRFEEQLSDPRYDKLPKDYEPGNKDEIRSLTHLACESLSVLHDNEKLKVVGTPLLGIFKADVDNLGEVFGGAWNKIKTGPKGNPQSKDKKERPATTGLDFSRAATLSRRLDYFFNGWLGTEVRKNYPSTYTVFAGGDDLFLIGPWNRILELAENVRKQFRRYTGHNPSLSLSAGITIAKPRQSLLRLAHLAEEELEQSKRATGKDHVTTFGITFAWSRYGELLETGKTMGEWLRKKTVSTGTIYNLLTFIGMRERLESKDSREFSIHDAGWRALLHYQLERNLDTQHREEPEIKRALHDFEEKIQEYGEQTRLAVYKALYENRND